MFKSVAWPSWVSCLGSAGGKPALAAAADAERVLRVALRQRRQRSLKTAD